MLGHCKCWQLPFSNDFVKQYKNSPLVRYCLNTRRENCLWLLCFYTNIDLRSFNTQKSSVFWLQLFAKVINCPNYGWSQFKFEVKTKTLLRSLISIDFISLFPTKMIPNRILIEWEGKKWSAKTNLLLRLHGPLDSIMNSPVSWLISKRPDQGRILSLDMYESSSTSRRGIRLKPLHTPVLVNTTVRIL